MALKIDLPEDLIHDLEQELDRLATTAAPGGPLSELIRQERRGEV
jgi:hypothetical protein